MITVKKETIWFLCRQNDKHLKDVALHLNMTLPTLYIKFRGGFKREEVLGMADFFSCDVSEIAENKDASQNYEEAIQKASKTQDTLTAILEEQKRTSNQIDMLIKVISNLIPPRQE